MKEVPINLERQAYLRGVAAFHGVDLPALARRLRVSRQSLNRVVNGQRTSARIEKALLGALGIRRLPSCARAHADAKS
jgi:hypothetical protein